MSLPFRPSSLVALLSSVLFVLLSVFCTFTTICCFFLTAVAFALIVGSGGSGLAATIIKVSLITPEGSAWTNLLYELADEVKDQTNGEVVFKVLAGIAALSVMVYTGFILNSVKGMPFWNSALLPLLFILFGGLGGLAVTLIIGLLGGDVDLMTAVAGIRWLVILNAFLLADDLPEETGRLLKHGCLACVSYIDACFG